MPSPLDYAGRYWELQVEVNSHRKTLRIDQYRLGDPPAAKDILWTKLKEYFQKKQKADPSWRLEIRINGGTTFFPSYVPLAPWVVRPFTGKGNPESFQLVLQLAVLLQIENENTLQAYCDKNLGLDCNGFVGNFLYYTRPNTDWMEEPASGAGGPNDSINQFERFGTPVQDTEKMSPQNTYLCLETRNGQVIPGGKSGVGHMVITQAGRYMPQSFVFDSFGGVDMGLSKKGAYGHRSFFVVESTGNKGLVQSWYAFPKSTNAKGLHKVFRGSKSIWFDCKIIDLGMI
jgi:hypothetical protein